MEFGKIWWLGNGIGNPPSGPSLVSSSFVSNKKVDIERPKAK